MSETWDVLSSENGERFRLFDYGDGTYLCTYSPADRSYSAETGIVDWGGLQWAAEQWVVAMVREREVEDPWATRLALASILSNGEESDDESNGLFSATEQAEIRATLSDWETRIVHALEESDQATSELKLYVARQFEYLREAASTKGRRDWRAMARDFFVNIAATVAIQISPSAADTIVGLANGGLRALGH